MKRAGALAFMTALVLTLTARAEDPRPLDFSRAWTADRSIYGTDPFGTAIKVTAQTPTSVTMSFKKGNYCFCQEQQLHVDLDHSYACASSTLSFDYHGDSSRPLHAPEGEVLAIAFCHGDDCSTLFLEDDAKKGFGSFVGATAAGEKTCLRERPQRALASIPKPTIHEGTNVIDLSALEPFVNGRCEGYFEAIEIHVMASSCDEKTRSIKLSNMRITGPEASPPAPPAPPPPPASAAPPPSSAPVPPPAPTQMPTATAPPKTRREPHYDEVYPRGYAAYAIGGGSSNQSTFRQGLDLSLGVTFLKGRHSEKGVLFNGVLNTGFGASPTYVAIEAGYIVVDYLGYLLTLGPAMRVAPNVAYGIEGSTVATFFGVIHGGVRAIGVFGNTFDGQIQAVLGFGFF